MARSRSDHVPSRERLLAAARHEFAARGFDGAKVDRIAARARVNKAMLYYHFRNKAALYREIIRELFHGVALAVQDVRRQGGAPEEQLRHFIDAIASQGVARQDFPALWLREIADGGRRIDASIVTELERVLAVLEAILQDGRRTGCFREVDPFVIHISIVAPLLFFAASAPARSRGAELGAGSLDPDRKLLIAHVQAITLAALTRPAPSGTDHAPGTRNRT